jgi:hypothetical protein
VTDLTRKKSVAAAVAGVALLATACGGRDQPELGARAEAPTSVLESAPSTVDAAATISVAPPTVLATTAPAVATAPVLPQTTLEDVLREVDQALADIDNAPADTDATGTSATKAAATIEGVKAKCVKAIADRQSKLDGLAAKVAQSPDPHDDDLSAIITTSRSGLIALRAAIEANTSDLATLKRDCQRVLIDLRIYELRVPQINLVMSIDKLATATTKIDGVDVAGLLAITPSVYNADKKVLRPYLQSVRSARSDLAKASQFAKQ